MFNKLLAGLLIYVMAVSQVVAQTAALVPNAKQTFLGTTGAPLAAGTVTMYVPNSTNKKTTWVDPNQASSNTNPIILDAAGRGVIFGQGNYRQVVKDKNGVQIWDSFTSAPGSAAPSGATGTDTAPVGTIVAYSGFSLPVNWQLAYGQAVSRTTFSELKTALTIVDTTASCTNSSTTITGFVSTAQFRVGAPIEASCIGTGITIATIAGATSITVSSAASATVVTTSTVYPWGNGDGVSTFNVPDLRGRVLPGADAMGGTAASRLTSAFYGASASPPSVSGGAQSQTLAQNQLPNIVPTLSGTPAVITSTSANGILSSNGNNAGVGGPSGLLGTVQSVTANYTPAGIISSINGNVTQQAFAIIQPSLTINYMIKMAPNSTGAGGVVSIGGMFGDIVCDSTLTCAPIGSPSVNTIGCTPATTSQLGCVQPDGTTTSIVGGKLIAIGGVATQISVGTTGVTAGASGRILYDNGGLLGELATTGSGTVVLSTAPSIVNPTITGSLTATGLVTNADLVNSLTSVNSQSCVLGAACSVSPLGTVHVNASTSTATAPDGSNITCASTTTHCFQEAITYAQTNHYNFKADCASNNAFLSFTSALSFGPGTSIYYDLSGCSVAFSGFTGDAIKLDTLNQGSHLKWTSGYITSTATGGSAVITINPHTAAPGGGTAFQGSRVDFPYVLAGASVSRGVVFFETVTSTFSIANGNVFTFSLIDGNAGGFFAPACIVVENPPNANNAFAQNIINFTSCQNPATTGIKIGTTAPTGVLGTNIWQGMVGVGTTQTFGIETFGQLDQFYLTSVSVNAGSLTTGIIFRSGANHNYIIAPQMEGATPVNDGGTGNCGVINDKQKACPGGSW